MSAAIILFAHGARDPEWARPFEQIRDLIQSRLPDTPVRLAFLELMQPTLTEAVCRLDEQGIRHITLIPMFLARGGHLKQDLPDLIARIRTQHPALTLHLSPAIGEVDLILRQLSDWICAEHRAHPGGK